MTIRRRLTVRYALIVAACLVLLGGLVHHEFITEPRERKALGIPELRETLWGEYAEVFFYAMIPLVLGVGWWFMRQTLAPITELTRDVARMHAGNIIDGPAVVEQYDSCTLVPPGWRLRVDPIGNLELTVR